MHDELAAVPPVDVYLRALAILFRRLKPAQDTAYRALLSAHYAAPERTASASDLARALGRASHSPINSLYGNLGRTLIGAIRQVDRGFIYRGRRKYHILATAKPGAAHGQYLWVMRPEVAEALETLGIVSQPT